MSRQVTVDVLSGGAISCIETPQTSAFDRLGSVSRRRISRVEPSDLARRVIFYAVRSIVRDTSNLAAWTRRWRCAWRVRMLDSGTTFGRFESRADAIAAEVDYWHKVECFRAARSGKAAT